MRRALMISAALALLTPVAANAQETNEDAPAVNAPEAVIFTGEESELDDMSIEDLNQLQLARLEQDAYDIAEESDETPTIVADQESPDDMTDEAAPGDDPVFTAEDETVQPDEEDEDATAMGGPYYEDEEDAMNDRYMQDTSPEEPDITLPENDPVQPAEDPMSDPTEE